MAPTLADITSQYGLLKLLVGKIWKKDLDSLSKTCTAMNEHIYGSDTTYRNLVDETLGCDGSGVEIWKADWIPRSNLTLSQMIPVSNSVTQPALHASFLKQRDKILEMVRCDDEGSGKKETTKPCNSCGRLVCNTCRFHDSYAEVVEQAAPLQTELMRAAHYAIDSEYTCRVYGYAFIDEYEWRGDFYCDACLPDVIQTWTPKNEDGTSKKCVCMEESLGWFCVPCFKNRIVQRPHAKYLCANRKKVAGCLGVSRGQTAICRWCRCEGPEGRLSK